MRYCCVCVEIPPNPPYKPYAGVSTAVLIFTKTGASRTDWVWFYDMTADGLSLDDKRQPVQQNDIPDLLQRCHSRVAPDVLVLDGSYKGLPLLDENEETPKVARSCKAFFVPKDEIQANGYDLSINRYKEVEYEEVEYEEVEYEAPKLILQKLRNLEEEIKADEKLRARRPFPYAILR